MISTYLKILTFMQCSNGLTTSQLPSPRSLSFKQTNEFCVNLAWDKPSKRSTCDVEYKLLRTGNVSHTVSKTSTFEMFTSEDMKNKDFQFSVTTKPISNCNQTESDPVTITVSPPSELVKDCQCSFYLNDAMNCTWLPANSVTNLQIYWTTGLKPPKLKLCEYMYKDLERRGCHLSIPISEDEVYFLVNGSLGDTSVTNTFRRIPRYHVKPPPPKLEITEVNGGRDLRFSWNPPDVPPQNKYCWDYKINYSKCNESMDQSVFQPKTENISVPYDRNCQYRVQIKSIFREHCGNGGSDLSDVKTYGVDGDPNWSLTLAAILVPIMLSACVILTLVCLRRHRTILFPTIPEPPSIIKDLMNKTKRPVEKLYIPVPEETYCKVSLVSESHPKQTES